MIVSTRGGTDYSCTEAVLQGLAPDGGLFVDTEIPVLSDIPDILSLEYTAMADQIMSKLLPGFEGIIHEAVCAYINKFDTSAITPLIKAGGIYFLELWHGPTCAFKDIALTILPYLIKGAKNMAGINENISILTATSGDTGKAALEGFHDVDGTDITVFFPHGGVSPMQNLQMVTQEGKNVRVCAVRGNFDDCQRGVKDAFSVKQNKKRLSSANSINIGRLVPQVVYYFYAYAALIKRNDISYGDMVDFVVPTGNFGDILAGYIAKKMGLSIGRLICASNSNSVLFDFISTGTYDKRRPFVKTISPSMDILVSSNLERLLYYASGNNSSTVRNYMSNLNKNGIYKADELLMKNIRTLFSAELCSEESCRKTINEIWNKHSYLIDTHTAVACNSAIKYMEKTKSDSPCVVLSTASAYKFPTAVLNAVKGAASDDEFENAYLLSKITGAKIPSGISDLVSRPVLHTDVIGIDEIVDYSLA